MATKLFEILSIDVPRMDFPSYEVSDKMGLKVNTLPDGYPAGSIVVIKDNKAYKIGDQDFPVYEASDEKQLMPCTFGFVIDGSFRLDNIVSGKVSVLQRPGVRVKIHKSLLAEPIGKNHIEVGSVLTFGVKKDDNGTAHYGFRTINPPANGTKLQLVCKVYNIDTDYVYAETVDYIA
jgi:hypothetical protein